MFGGFGKLSAKEFGARVTALSAGGGRGGQSVPNRSGHTQSSYRGQYPQTTKPLCLYCDQQKAKS